MGYLTKLGFIALKYGVWAGEFAELQGIEMASDGAKISCSAKRFLGAQKETTGGL